MREHGKFLILLSLSVCVLMSCKKDKISPRVPSMVEVNARFNPPPPSPEEKLGAFIAAVDAWTGVHVDYNSDFSWKWPERFYFYVWIPILSALLLGLYATMVHDNAAPSPRQLYRKLRGSNLPRARVV